MIVDETFEYNRAEPVRAGLLLTADQNEKDSLVPSPVSHVLSKMAEDDNLSTEQDSKDTGVH